MDFPTRLAPFLQLVMKLDFNWLLFPDSILQITMHDATYPTFGLLCGDRELPSFC